MVLKVVLTEEDMMYRIPDGFADVFRQAQSELSECGAFFVNEEYVRKTNSKIHALDRTISEVVASIPAILSSDDALLYSLFLYRAMEQRERFLSSLSEFEIPDKEFAHLAVLCLLPYFERLYDFLSDNGLDEDIRRATVNQLEDCMFLYLERTGNLGLNKRYFDHLQRYVDFGIFNIGALRFEPRKLGKVKLLEHRVSGKEILVLTEGRMNSDGLYIDTPPINEDGAFDAFFLETESEYIGTRVGDDGKCRSEHESFSKDEYILRMTEGDDCIAVHIPQDTKLTKERCNSSYERAAEVFSRLYPERNFKAFVCSSWMMSPQLFDILGKDSKILAFSSPYIKFPSHTKGRDVMNFVFKTESPDVASWQENTTLQRELKKLYLGGDCLYEYYGIYPIKRRIPISIIIDDSAPMISTPYFNREHKFTQDGRPLIPYYSKEAIFTLADIIERHGAKGKFSILPMAGNQGDIISGFAGVDKSEVDEWLDCARRRVTPAFSITPEMLSHCKAVNIETGEPLSEREDDWAEHQDRSGLTQYIAKALELIKAAGFDCHGVTSPWCFGEGVEEEYVAAISSAMHDVYGYESAYYFLHSKRGVPNVKPWIAYDKSGRKVVSIPATIADHTWQTIDCPRTDEEYVRKIADEYITEDGLGGSIPKELELNSYPILCMHWQSLCSNGLMTGFRVLDEVLRRVNLLLKDRVVWRSLEELMQESLK